MPAMTDPTDALVSFQQAFLAGAREFQRAKLDPQLFIHLDHSNGHAIYLRALPGQGCHGAFDGGRSIEGIPCFQIGVAVPEEYGRRGLATDVVPADQPWCWGRVVW
ncbi:hypothetical protein ACKWRH_05560 [Bradyrhizobium sp. Pa8]|uniref:hypothetical protein n=1 Tax=Bradyrhizobium sp. Pa8 TaxID=3386552 RepID=UPI00403EF78A